VHNSVFGEVLGCCFIVQVTKGHLLEEQVSSALCSQESVRIVSIVGNTVRQHLRPWGGGGGNNFVIGQIIL
jgi:hypothetical protein